MSWVYAVSRQQFCSLRVGSLAAVCTLCVCGGAAAVTASVVSVQNISSNPRHQAAAWRAGKSERRVIWRPQWSIYDIFTGAGAFYCLWMIRQIFHLTRYINLEWRREGAVGVHLNLIFNLYRPKTGRLIGYLFFSGHHSGGEEYMGISWCYCTQKVERGLLVRC